MAAIYKTKNSQENKDIKTTKVIVISTKIGNKLKVLILKTWANDCDPFDTILIIFPVSLLKWNARDYLWTWSYTSCAIEISAAAAMLA